MEHDYSVYFRVERAYSNLKDAIESLLLESTSANQCRSLTINIFKMQLAVNHQCYSVGFICLIRIQSELCAYTITPRTVD